MGCRTIRDTEQNYSVMYDSGTDTAFGPVFSGTEAAEAFVQWLRTTTGQDPRMLEHADLVNQKHEFEKVVCIHCKGAVPKPYDPEDLEERQEVGLPVMVCFTCKTVPAQYECPACCMDSCSKCQPGIA